MSQLIHDVQFQGGCIFENDLIIARNVFMNFVISDATIIKKFKLVGAFNEVLLENINKDPGQGILHTSRATFIKFTCSGSYFQEILIRDNSELKGRFLLKDSKTNLLEVIQVKIFEYFETDNLEAEKVNVDNIEEMRKFQLKNSKLGDWRFALSMINTCEINNCEFKSLTIWGKFNENSYFNIEKSKGDILKFENVINGGLIAIRDVKLNLGGKLSLLSSNLGNTDFIRSDFSNSLLEFDNSKLTEVFVAETDFPTRVRGILKNDHSQAQLAFGQLHNAFERQGDMVRSLEYRAREIEAHYFSLKDWWTSKPPFLNFDKLNLAFNKISNNFGRSWIRGIGFSFTVGILFFYLVVISSDKYSIGLAIHINDNLIESFFRFMYPLRFLETEKLFSINNGPPYLSLNWYGYIADFFGRIAIAYGYYQTIQAFRKFGRQ